MAEPRPVLIVIGEDPRASHRANEALRIAVGIVAGEHDVRLVLTGPAAHILDEDTDALVDGDDIARFRASLRRLGVPCHVEAGAVPEEASWNPDGLTVVPVTTEEVAGMAAAAARCLIF